VRSTADDLSFFSNNSIDIIFYGFCLYLTDKKDYCKISNEANRVLKNKGILIIYDFYSEKRLLLPYKHHDKVKITKMDFSKIFNKKNFFCKYKKFYDYETLIPKIKDKEASVAIIILKKK
jgi:ubiquinone/menaquinone biosynthesis C-methylase UbiE